jgi:O-antigen/teichoic acid export membrane protein/Mrp family chromosome partitioning ATPase
MDPIKQALRNQQAVIGMVVCALGAAVLAWLARDRLSADAVTPRRLLALAVVALGLVALVTVTAAVRRVSRRAYGAVPSAPLPRPSVAPVERVLAGAPLLGVIAEDPHGAHVLTLVDEPGSARADAYRRLQRQLAAGMGQDGLRLAVSSEADADGKTLLVANLGIAFAEAGYRVALVDADVAAPKLGRLLGVPTSAGLADVVVGGARVDAAVRPWRAGVPLVVLPATANGPEPDVALAPARLEAVLEELRDRADVILVDTPAALPSEEAALFARVTSGVLLVARTPSGGLDAVGAAADGWAARRDDVVGVVMNWVPGRTGAVSAPPAVHPGAVPAELADVPPDVPMAAEGPDEAAVPRRGKKASYREALGFGILSFGSLALLGVLSSIVIARLYGIDVVGEFGLVSAPMSILWSLSSVKEQMALMRELAVKQPREPSVTGLFAAIYCVSMGLTIIAGLLVAGGVLLLFHGPIDHPELVKPALCLIAIYILLTNNAWNLETVMAGFRAGKQLFVIRLAQALGFFACSIVGAETIGTVWALVLATAVGSALELVFALYFVRGFLRLRVPREDIREGFRALPRMVKFGAKMAPAGIADGVSYEAPTFLLGSLGIPLAAVGAWSRAWMLSRRFLEANYKIFEALFPTLVERRASGDHAGFNRALAQTVRLSALGMLFPAAVGGGAAVGIMEIFGPGFDRGSTALAIGMLLPAVYGVAGVFALLLVSNDRPLTDTAVALLRLVTVLGLGWPLIHWFGITGAAVTMLTAFSISLTLLVVLALPHLSQPWHQLWPPTAIIAIVAAYLAGFLAARLVDNSLGGAVGVIAAMVAGTLAYVVAYVVCGGLTREDRTRIRRLVPWPATPPATTQPR